MNSAKVRCDECRGLDSLLCHNKKGEKTAAMQPLKSSLILASTSPYRRALMERLGLPFSVRRPPFDEDSLKGQALKPLELATRLAREKARSAQQDPDEILIGSDQLGCLESSAEDFEILGKPHTRERNIEQLLKLSGRKHT